MLHQETDCGQCGDAQTDHRVPDVEDAGLRRMKADQQPPSTLAAPIVGCSKACTTDRASGDRTPSAASVGLRTVSTQTRPLDQRPDNCPLSSREPCLCVVQDTEVSGQLLSTVWRVPTDRISGTDEQSTTGKATTATGHPPASQRANSGQGSTAPIAIPSRATPTAAPYDGATPLSASAPTSPTVAASSSSMAQPAIGGIRSKLDGWSRSALDGLRRSTSGDSGTVLPQLSLDEIRQHNRPDSCWLIVHDVVYDATCFLTCHPAGPRPILNRGGMDATQDFYYHSPFAKRLWKDLPQVGQVDEQGRRLLKRSRSSLHMYRSDCCLQ